MLRLLMCVLPAISLGYTVGCDSHADHLDGSVIRLVDTTTNDRIHLQMSLERSRDCVTVRVASRPELDLMVDAKNNAAVRGGELVDPLTRGYLVTWLRRCGIARPAAFADALVQIFEKLNGRRDLWEASADVKSVQVERLKVY
jgi:hypothetical protein